jgi:hypothetical protein
LKQKQIINSFLDLCELEAMNADSILMTHDMRGVTKKKELSFGSSVESPSSETEEKEDNTSWSVNVIIFFVLVRNQYFFILRTIL